MNQKKFFAFIAICCFLLFQPCMSGCAASHLPTISISNDFSETILSYLENNTENITGQSDMGWHCSYYFLGADEKHVYLQVMKASLDENSEIDEAVILPIKLQVNQENKIVGYEAPPDGVASNKFYDSLPSAIREKILLYNNDANNVNEKLETDLLLRAKSKK